MYKKSMMTPGELKENYNENMDFLQTCEEHIALTMRRKKIGETLINLKQEVDEEYFKILSKEQMLQKEAKRLLDLANVENKHLTELSTTILKHIQKEISESIEDQENDKAQVQQIFEKHEPQIIIEKQPLKSCLSQTAIKSNSVVKSVKINNFVDVESGAKKKTLTQSLNKLALNQNLVTPKMSINEYIASPLVKRPKVNRNPFMFLEFEVQLKKNHFDKISKYMRGRETLDELNQFLEQVIIPCFNEKYQLLHRERSTVRHLNELDLWKLYNEQTTLVPGCHFITPGDISRKINKILDKKLLNRLTILRHVGLLQEKRIAQTTCYIWNSKFI